MGITKSSNVWNITEKVQSLSFIRTPTTKEYCERLILAYLLPRTTSTAPSTTASPAVHQRRACFSSCSSHPRRRHKEKKWKRGIRGRSRATKRRRGSDGEIMKQEMWGCSPHRSMVARVFTSYSYPLVRQRSIQKYGTRRQRSSPSSPSFSLSLLSSLSPADRIGHSLFSFSPPLLSSLFVTSFEHLQPSNLPFKAILQHLCEIKKR